ncbi:hypothetical protein H4582DRAFT_2070136 [Lactarius indigo]|nr:hypothetical protein H4582DRAFT_2070136 [Lactarius indigo]
MALPQKSESKTRRLTTALPDSPAPSDPSSLSNPTPAENVVLPAYLYDLSTRPRLTISRAPAFVPISEDSQYYNTDQLAHNRLGFRYMPAGLAPEGSTNPFRTIESAPQAYRVSWEDRSPFVKVTQDGLGLLGEKGFRSARCNAPVREGRWYMEVSVEHGGGARAPDAPGPPTAEGAHVRLGWGRREAPLGGPCGLDGYSYGMRDKTGEKITLSRPRAYGEPFGAGDVVGMYISLPALREGAKRDPHDPAHVKRERIAIEFKGQEYFESLEYTQSKEMIALMDFSRKPNADTSAVPPPAKKSATVKNVPERGRGASSSSEPAPMRPLPTLADSKIAFFVNGRCQGVAFRELRKKRTREGAREHKENHFDDGSLGYFPLVSLFNGARVRLNPGPDFAFPPPSDIDAVLVGDAADDAGAARTWRPLCERYSEFMEEQWALDRIEEEQARVEAAQRAATVQAEAEKKSEPSAPGGSGAPHATTAHARAGSHAASNTPQPEREESAPLTEDVTMRPLIGPGAALPAYMLNELHIHVETDQTSTGPSTPGPQSAYDSEYGDGEAEEQEQEQEQEEDAPPDDLSDIYGDPAKLLQYRRAAAIRMEEEED